MGSNELARGVMISGLFCGIVYSNGVYAGDSRLHLKLGVVNAGLKIQKELGKMLDAQAPVDIKVMAKETNQHGAHAKVDVTRLN